MAPSRTAASHRTARRRTGPQRSASRQTGSRGSGSLLAESPLAASPWAEFDIPYALRVSPDGEAVEMSGSFSAVVPPALRTILARAPRIRTVVLDSPGGQLKAAAAVAQMIRARGLNTYVDRFCASACTIAFLAGAERQVAPGARIGFHQAHARDATPLQLDPLLRAQYAKAHLPPAFIEHVLRTPPDSLWIPTHQELQAAGIVSSGAAVATDVQDSVVRDWPEAMLNLAAADDTTVLAAADTLVTILDELQAASPDGCWGFMHNAVTATMLALKPRTLAAMATVEQHVREETWDQPPGAAGASDRVGILAQLVEVARADGQGPIMAALLPDGDHAAYCPALRRLVAAARTLPPPRQQEALRTLLGSG